MRTTTLGFAIGLAGVILTGCNYTYSPVLVEVRDRASHEPVADADVRIANTRTLNPDPPAPAIGETNTAGYVILDVGLYNNIVVRVTPPGGRTHVFSAEHPAYVGQGLWITPIRTEDASIPKVEIRLSPSTASAPAPAEPQPASAPNP